MTDPAAAEDAARGLLELANEDPAAALPRAVEVMDAAVRRNDDRLAAIAARAAGLAEAMLGDLRAATNYLSTAVGAAIRSGDTDLEGETEMTAGAVLCWAGDNATGRRWLDRAVEILDGVKGARALVQRGSIHYRAAEFELALADFDAALDTLSDADDRMWLAHLYTNRGLSLAYRGSLETAERELERAQAIYDDLGHRFSVVQMLHNRGWVAARLGDVPGALERFDEAEAKYTELGRRPAELHRDRSAALISVHLADEAFTSAMQAASMLEEDGHAAAHAEALVSAAEAALLAERPADAIACAARAEEEFAGQQRTGWARYAELVALRARGRRGDSGPELWQRACDIADELHSSGLESGALTARVLAADLAMAAGDFAAAKAEMAKAAEARTDASVDLRAEAWNVTARIRLAAGDRHGAARAVDAGLRVVEQHQAVQGATETRAHAAGHAKRLAALGVELAWQSRNPRRALRWMERTRAGALRYPPVRIPDDAALAGDLAELRHVEHALRSGGVGPADQARFEQRRRRLEQAVQRRTRRVLGTESAATVCDVDVLLETLGDRMLIEYGRVGDDVVIVTAADGRVRRHSGPEVRAVTDAIDMMRFGLNRLAARRGSDASLAAARAAVAEAATGLSRMLLEPLPLGDRDLVLVPPPALHALAWGLLPATAGRPITVSPSAELWVRRRGTIAAEDPVLLSGPGLPEAPGEIAAVREVWPNAMSYDAESGSVAAVRSALEQRAIAHLACHGRFRADNPLFSALEMADGWFTVYDFETLESVPELMVLSACDAGLSAERPGDEVMGIVAGLLGAGARAVVASVGLVPDAASTRDVMTAFHRRLANGDRPSVALAYAQQQALAAGDLASASFVCFGHA